MRTIIGNILLKERLSRHPSIAQLVERRTVEVTLLSLGRWFKSGSKDVFFSHIPFAFFLLVSFFSRQVLVIPAAAHSPYFWCNNRNRYVTDKSTRERQVKRYKGVSERGHV